MKIKKDITLRFVPNLLSEEGRTLQSLPYDRTWTIRRYLKKSGVVFNEMRVSVNGTGVKNLRKKLNDGDEIVLTPDIEAPIAVWWAAATFWQGVALVAAATAVAYSIYSAIQSSRIKTPSFDTIGDGLDDGSPSASWTGVKTMREPGGVIPVIYGKRLTGGTVIMERK